MKIVVHTSTEVGEKIALESGERGVEVVGGDGGEHVVQKHAVKHCFVSAGAWSWLFFTHQARWARIVGW